MSMSSMRSRRAASAVALSFAALVVTGCAGQSSGACVAAEATASPTSTTADRTVTVSGRYWGPCNDTNHSFDEPWPLVSVEWRGPDGTVSLGDIAIVDRAFSGQVDIPASADPGDAVLWIGAHEYEVEIPMTVVEDTR
jgi:hypothetical protein